MADVKQQLLEPGVGWSIRRNRLRAGLTQVQLAKAISRSGKFLSEVENGKARITQRDLERLADAMGISCEKVVEDPPESEGLAWRTPRRIREVQPTGMTIMTFTQMLNHLDRSGWLRNAKLWMIGAEAFPEENDLALVEQIGSLVATKDVGLRYVYSASRLSEHELADLAPRQGSFDAIPRELLTALRWSNTMKELDPESDRVVGYAATWELPPICRCHTLIWVETEDVSWSDIMPLLYARSVTRTFENPNESVAFWHHLPRETGSRVLLELAQNLKTIS